MSRMATKPDNPFAAPDFSRLDALTDYYRIDNRRLRYAEIFRIGRNPIALFLLLTTRALHLKAPSFFRWVMRPPTRASLMRPDEVPRHVREAWTGITAAAMERGYRLALVYRGDFIGAIPEVYVAVFRSPDDRTGVSATYLRVRVGKQEHARAECLVGSRLADGRAITSTGTKGRLDSAPNTIVRYRPGLSPGALIDDHGDWVVREGFQPIIVPPDKPADLMFERERELCDHQVSRGPFVLITEREYEALTRLSATAAPAAVDPESRLGRRLGIVQGACFWLGLILVSGG